MQEQVPSNITPEQGWSHMKAILDREMPVQRKSRRMITWWRSLMAVGLLTALSLTAYNTFNKVEPQQQQPAQPPVQEQPATPVPADDKSSSVQENSFAQATENVPANEQPLNSTQTSDQDDRITTLASNETRTAKDKNVSIHAKSTTTSNTPSSTKSSSLSSNTVSSSSSSSSSNSVLATTSTPVQQSNVESTANSSQAIAFQDATSVEQSTANNITTASASDQTLEAIASATAQRNGQVTDAIPSLQADALVIDDQGSIDMNILAYLPTTQIKPVKQGGRMLEGYVAGSGMAGFNKGGAWQAGAGMSVRVVPKVRLAAGASYREYSPDFSFQSLAVNESQDGANVPIVNLDPLVNEGGFVNDYVLNPSTTYQELEPIVKTLRQWQLDASIICDLNKHWFVQAGASYAFNTTAASSYPILEDAYFANPYELRFTNELENYDVLRENMVTLHGGIGYHLGRNWDLYVQADHGLQPYLLSETSLPGGGLTVEERRSDYIRGLTLGVRYRVL